MDIKYQLQLFPFSKHIPYFYMQQYRIVGFTTSMYSVNSMQSQSLQWRKKISETPKAAFIRSLEK